MTGDGLLLIDVQMGMVETGRTPLYRAGEFLETIRQLQDRARSAGAPVVFLQHSGPRGHPVELHSEGWPIHPSVRPEPDEPIVAKTTTDGFHRSELEHVLRGLKITSPVVVGCLTEFCVDGTCRRAITLGFDVLLAADGHTTADAVNDVLPDPQVRIGLFNDVLGKLMHHDAALSVLPAGEIRFVAPAAG